MWYVLVLNVFLGFLATLIRSAWVEIPQVPTDNPKKSHFVFGSPKVSFPSSKMQSNTTPTNYKTLMTTTVAATTPAITLLTTSLTDPSVLSETSPENTINPPPRKEVNERAEMRVSHESGKSNETKQAKEDASTASSYSGFLPLLQSIQETLTLNAKKSLKSKISLLTNLRDNLLANIDDRMSTLFTSAEELPEARGHDDGEMEFPSNEGALMTIGFLTFAVFLIKLVLKLIHALKNKQQYYNTNNMMSNMMMGMMTGNGGGMMPTAAAFLGRKKRDLDDYDSLKILELIDEYKFT